MTTRKEDLEKLKELERGYNDLISRLDSDRSGNYGQILQLERTLCRVIAKRLEIEGEGLI